MARVVVAVICLAFVGTTSAAVVQVDLSGVFNRDTVLAPGEPADGTGGDFDGYDFDPISGAGVLGTGYVLLAEGWDGFADNPAASGPPEDGVVSDYQMGPLDGPNAINLSIEDEDAPVAITVPSGRYSQVRFLVSAGDGDCSVPITFQYATGDPVDALLMADDWFDDFPAQGDGGTLRAGLATVANGWDRFQFPTTFFDVNDPGLFAHTLAVDSTRELTGITLRPGDAGTLWERPTQTSPTALNIFAINLDTARNVPPAATVTADQQNPLLDPGPVDVTLTCTATDADGGPMALSYSWAQISAPTGAMVVFTPPLPVTDPEVVVTLDVAGDYVFTCRVADGADTVDASITITAGCPNKAPQISYTVSDTTVAPGGQVTADASATVDPDSGPLALAYAWEFVNGPMTQVDMTGVFNADGVFEPGGDYLTSTIDAGSMDFLVEGFDGINENQAHVQGLPADGLIGEFQLGPYDELNTVQFSNVSAELAVELASPVAGGKLVYLVTGGNGDSAVFTEIGYDDGSTSTGIMYCDDWFDDAADFSLRSEFLTAVLDGLDRATAAGTLEDSNDPAIFKGTIELEALPVATITLRPTDPQSTWAGVDTRFNLFGLWIEAGEVTIEAPASAITAITLGSTQGSYRFRLTVDDGDACMGAQAEEFVITVEGAPPELFKRGDVNQDSALNIADAVALLGHLFAQKPAPGCPDSADGNNDGTLNIADAVAILGHLFGGKGPLPDPFSACGVDSGAADALSTCVFAPCQ